MWHNVYWRQGIVGRKGELGLLQPLQVLDHLWDAVLGLQDKVVQIGLPLVVAARRSLLNGVWVKYKQFIVR